MIPQNVQSWILQQLNVLNYTSPSDVFPELVSVLNESDWIRPKTTIFNGVLLLSVFSLNTEIAIPLDYPDSHAFVTSRACSTGTLRALVSAFAPRPAAPPVPHKNPIVPPIPLKPQSPKRPSTPAQSPTQVIALPHVQSTPPQLPPKPHPVPYPELPQRQYKQLPPKPSKSQVAVSPDQGNSQKGPNSLNIADVVNNRPSDSTYSAPSPPPSTPQIDLMNESYELSESPLDQLISKLQQVDLELGDVDRETAELKALKFKLDKYESDLLIRKQTHQANIRAIRESTKKAHQLIAKVPQDLNLEGIEGIQKLIDIRSLSLETASASDQGITNVLNMLPKALDNGSITFEVYLRLVRQYAREQFLHRSVRIPFKPPKA